MLLLGLVLIMGAGAFTGLVIAYNTAGLPEYTVTMFGNTLATLNSLEIFVSGLVLATIICMGFALLGPGIRSRRVHHAHYRAARQVLAERRAAPAPPAAAAADAPAPAPAPAPAKVKTTKAADTATNTNTDTAPTEADTEAVGDGATRRGHRRLTIRH